jgi:hypothetical protein
VTNGKTNNALNMSIKTILLSNIICPEHMSSNKKQEATISLKEQTLA